MSWYRHLAQKGSGQRIDSTFGMSGGRSELTERHNESQEQPPPKDTIVSYQGLVIRRIESDSSVRFALGGDLDAYSAHMLEMWIRDEDRGDSSDMVIDLGRLSFIDSSGLRTLVSAARRSAERGRRFRVINARGTVRSIFDLTQMDSVIEFWQNAQPSPGTNQA